LFPQITIRPEMTLQEFYACQDALFPRKGVWIVTWAFVYIGAASLASSAALTWGTPASILAGLALAAFTFSFFLSGRIRATQIRQTYIRYRESNTSYTFTDERIVATSRHAESSLMWTAVDRLIELRTIYLLLTARNGQICLPKRDIPPHKLGEFIQLLRTHRLLRQV
jgi:hypothetical protein